MDLIEFLEKTNRKNIKNFIGVKVQTKLAEYESTLNERRQKLKDILDFENLQHKEELVVLAKEKLNEQMRKRLDWINTKCMERMQAEKELLELKQQQRELENCEAWRHFQSKQLLLDSKKGQLYQIEDKRLRVEREKQIDRMWQDVVQRLNNEKEYQEVYANKLLKVIERTNQLRNQKVSDDKQKKQEGENQKTKKEFQEENRKALLMQEKFRKEEQRKEFFKKLQHNQELKSQISENRERKAHEAELCLKEIHFKNEIENQKAFSELEQSEREKIYNKEWQKFYLKNAFNEKQQQIEKEKEFDRMYLNTGCVLQQSPKTPYRKSTR